MVSGEGLENLTYAWQLCPSFPSPPVRRAGLYATNLIKFLGSIPKMYRRLLAVSPCSKDSRVTLVFNTVLNCLNQRLHKSRKVYVNHGIKGYMHFKQVV
jgi:hypothetical protein